MSLVLLLALQSASPAPAAPPAPLPVEFDLAHVKPGGRCAPAADGTEILVCGRRPSTAYDLEKGARLFERGPLRAEKGIAPGTTVGAYVESVVMPDSTVSKRAMVG